MERGWPSRLRDWSNRGTGSTKKQEGHDLSCPYKSGRKRDANQLLMSDLVSSLASMGSRKGLLASGAPAMASFISLDADA